MEYRRDSNVWLDAKLYRANFIMREIVEFPILCIFRLHNWAVFERRICCFFYQGKVRVYCMTWANIGMLLWIIFEEGIYFEVIKFVIFLYIFKYILFKMLYYNNYNWKNTLKYEKLNTTFIFYLFLRVRFGVKGNIYVSLFSEVFKGLSFVKT